MYLRVKTTVMNQEAAVVLSQTGRCVQLSIETKNACSGCQVNANCGIQTMVTTTKTRSRILELQTDKTYRMGETVVVQIPDGYLTSMAMVVYLAPLIGFILGLLFGASFMPKGSVSQDVIALFFGLIGGCGSWLLAQFKVKQMEQNQQPLITAQLGQLIYKQSL